MSLTMARARRVMAPSFRSEMLGVREPIILEATCVCDLGEFVFVRNGEHVSRNWGNSTAGWVGSCFCKVTTGGAGQQKVL